MRYLRSARFLLAAGMAALGLLVAGCSGSAPHSDGSQHPGPAATATTGTVGNPTGTAPTGSGSAAPTGTGTTAPYPTPGKEPDLNSDQTGVLNALPGSASAGCEVVGTHTDVRSGSFAAGNFRQARQAYAKAAKTTEVPEVSLYLIPQTAKDMRTVTITIDPSGSGATRTVISKSVEQAEAWSYFAADIPVATPGTYRVIVVSGANKGCFEVSFTS